MTCRYRSISASYHGYLNIILRCLIKIINYAKNASYDYHYYEDTLDYVASGIVTPGLTRARAMDGNPRWLFELNLSV